MASPSASPNILVKEIDLTGVVPSVTSSTGVTVGNFNWGPVEQPVLLSNESQLAETFGSPSLTAGVSSIDFIHSAMFLKYSTSLYVTRTTRSAANASASGTGLVYSIAADNVADYTGTPTLVVTTDGSGTGAEATATMEVKGVTSTPVAAGIGYSVGDLLYVDLGTGTNAELKVDTISSTPVSGAITGVSLVNGGSFTGSLDSLTGHATTTNGGGTNATITVTVGIKFITVTDGGSGYAESDTNGITESGSTGGASYTVVVADDGADVKNLDDWNVKKTGLGAEQIIAKYPGLVGNSLSVKICPANAGAFSGWTETINGAVIDWSLNFDSVAGTSSYVASQGGSLDEAHVVVVDQLGYFTGAAGTVLEVFPYVSFAGDAKTSDGRSNYILDVLSNQSAYVWAADIFAYSAVGQMSSVIAGPGSTATTSLTLSGGVNSSDLEEADVIRGFDLYQDSETIQVDFLIAPGMANATKQQAVVAELVSIAASSRKDCVVVTSPDRTSVLSQSSVNNIVNASVAAAGMFPASNYLIVDNNYLKVFDKYNDQYIFVAASSSTAGLMALTDQVSAPWFSPAGQRRGQYFGVTALAYNANKTQRDSLYKVGINPVVNLPGQGITLYGDKTRESRPSAFDRINVRRLFLVIERAIKSASSNVMFEFNDEFTRAEFVNIVEPFLREIKGRRGITDFRVVCDETNNTANVIDSNRFVASIFVKPARSINYITLNFVAVRTGVEFDEIVGTV